MTEPAAPLTEGQVGLVVGFLSGYFDCVVPGTDDELANEDDLAAAGEAFLAAQERGDFEVSVDPTEVEALGQSARPHL